MLKIEPIAEKREYWDNGFLLHAHGVILAKLGVTQEIQIDPLLYLTLDVLHVPPRSWFRQLRRDWSLHMTVNSYCNIPIGEKNNINFARFFGYTEAYRTDEVICLERQVAWPQ